MAHLLISQSYLKAKGIIDDNADFQKITPIIELVQDLNILPALGTDLYNQIVTQSTPPTTLTSANQTLLDDHILKCMVYFIQAKAPLVFQYRFMNKGIMTRTAENANPVDPTTLKMYQHDWLSAAEMYTQRMTNYILDNLSSYPAYQTNNGLSRELPRTNAFQVDMYLPDGPAIALTNDTGPIKDSGSSNIGTQIF